MLRRSDVHRATGERMVGLSRRATHVTGRVMPLLPVIHAWLVPVLVDPLPGMLAILPPLLGRVFPKDRRPATPAGVVAAIMEQP